jgi:hypothetical protein
MEPEIKMKYESLDINNYIETSQVFKICEV